MAGFATVTSKNQITLPADLARILSWSAGTDLWVKSEGQRVILERIPTIGELRNEIQKNPRVKGLNKKYTSVEIVHMARQMKPPKHVYDY